MKDFEMISNGWYSKKQSESTGTAEYRTPGGGTVEVTDVTTSMDQPSDWDDIIHVGEVTTFVRRLSEPTRNGA